MMLKLSSKIKLIDVVWALVAVFAGALVFYVGKALTGVDLELYFGLLHTFRPMWIVTIIVVPFVAGMVVSAIYGLGGKMLANFSPLIILIPEYIASYDMRFLTEGVSVLPIGYWILVVIVCVEACAGGGIVGEYVIKKTYGRSAKSDIHIRYQVDAADKEVAPKTDVRKESL